MMSSKFLISKTKKLILMRIAFKTYFKKKQKKRWDIDFNLDNPRKAISGTKIILKIQKYY